MRFEWEGDHCEKETEEEIECWRDYQAECNVCSGREEGGARASARLSVTVCLLLLSLSVLSSLSSPAQIQGFKDAENINRLT